MATCPGYCCAVIHQPGTRDELAAVAGILQDGELVLDMIQPISREDATRRRQQHGLRVDDLETAKDGHLYTCRHWDDRTRLCGIYERRPAMCRDYPYAESCAHCGLTMGITQEDRVQLERSKRRARHAAVNVPA